MKTNIKNLLAILALSIIAVFIENIFVKSIQVNNKAYDTLTKAAVAGSGFQLKPCVARAYTGEKVALDQVDVPLYPGAQRLTFDGGDTVRYRLPAKASVAADFYSAKLRAQCWRSVKQLASSKKVAKLKIALVENPISKKTEVTYSFLPPENVNVLGIELAQDSTTPPPTGDTTQIYNSTPPPPQPTTEYNNPVPPPDGSAYPTPTSPQPTEQPMPYPSRPTGTETQTCRVNGVDMPGPCANYNSGPSTGLEFSRPERSNMGPQGPSEEEMKRMDERRFQDMKRGLSQFARGAKMMKKSVSKMKAVINKCGVNIPTELENALANSDNIIGKIQSAQNADELEDIISEVEDVGSVMQEWGPRLGDLHRLCQMLKQADKDIKQLERSLKRSEANDKANKKIDLSEIIATYKNDINNLKETLSQAKQLAQSDPEAALEKLEDDFYGQMDNVRNNQAAVDMALNASRGLKDAAREIKNYEKQIKNLERKKIDTAEAKELLGKLKEQIEEIKNSLKGSFDPEEFMDKVEETFSSREALQDILQELGSGPQIMPQIKVNNNYNVRVDLPESFKKQKGENEEETIEDNLKP